MNDCVCFFAIKKIHAIIIIKGVLMKSIYLKLIWWGSPLTKVIYAYLAYLQQKEINNSFNPTSLLILIIGIITATISILLSKKIYDKSFYENKIVRAFTNLNRINNETENSPVIFALFAMLLGLAESSALFGFVQFIITGNLLVAIILYAFCFTAWLFNYPQKKNIQ